MFGPLPRSLVALALLLGLVTTACAARTGSLGLTEEATAGLSQGSTPKPAAVVEALVAIEDFWSSEFESVYGVVFEPVGQVVAFDSATAPLENLSACLTDVEDREFAANAFFCPQEDSILIDEGVLFPEIRSSFGEYAVSAVLAHEYGHVIQARLGVFEPDAEPVPGIVLELQADCFAGVWGHHAATQRNLLEEGDVEEGLNAAAAIGDDRLQRQAGQYVNPESWTHGSSKQRVEWFTRGLKHGRMDVCDTFQDL